MNNKKINILVVDDEKEITKSLSKIIQSEGFNCYEALSAEEALEIINSNCIDIVLSDIIMEGMNGIELLKEIGEKHPYIHTLMLTAYGTIDSSIEAIKNGAFGYLLKPFSIEEVLNEIEKIKNLIRLEKENREYKKKEDEEYHLFESRNPAMKNIINIISTKLATSESTILLNGESGTGKEIIANYIHSRSHRSRGPFIKVSCAALSEGLLESELFGHVKGAFTGAIKDKIGRFEAANSGTIFLDEIGDFSPIIQLKMLRVIQERVIEMVGQNTPKKVDTRIIAATNKNLEELVKKNQFREDLFYRINVIKIELPPLRKRKEDIPIFVENFIKKYSVKNNIIISHIEEKALQALLAYDWPGNIRELENVIERAVILADNGVITINNLIDNVKKQTNDKQKKIFKLKDARESFEKEFITNALKRNNFNITNTAKELNIARKNLYEKLKKLNIHY